MILKWKKGMSVWQNDNMVFPWAGPFRKLMFVVAIELVV